MTERIKMIIIGAAVVVVLLIGYGLRGIIHHCPACPKCPELVSRSHIEREIVGPPKDTARAVKYAPSITRRTVPATPTIAPVLPDVRTSDSVVSYEVIDTMQDQAVIGFSIASRELPDKYLPDLVHRAWYLAKPDRIKIISDTLTVQLPALQCPSRFWREVRIGTVCIGIGAAGTAAYFFFK